MNRLIRAGAAGIALGFTLFFAVFPVDALADANEDLHAAHAKMLGSRFVNETVSTDAKGNKTLSRAEFDTSARIRLITDTGGFIIVPEGTWMRTSADGEWTRPPFDLGGMLKTMLPQTIEEVRSGTKNIRDEGTRTIDGQALRVISYDVDSKVMGISVSSSNRVFLDAQGRIVRTETDGVAMGKKTTSVQTTRYDDSIRVSAPD